MTETKTTADPLDECCSPKPDLEDRPLMNQEEAIQLGDLFQELASETRLRILHALQREETLSVNEITDRVDMKPQAVSNQLRRMRDRNILRSSRDGNQVFYEIDDPCIPHLIDLGWCLYEEIRENSSC